MAAGMPLLFQPSPIRRQWNPLSVAGITLSVQRIAIASCVGSGISHKAWPLGLVSNVPTTSAKRKRCQPHCLPIPTLKHLFQPLPLRGSGISLFGHPISPWIACSNRFRLSEVVSVPVPSSPAFSVRSFQPLPLCGSGINVIQSNTTAPFAARSNRFRFAEAVSADKLAHSLLRFRVPTASGSRKRYQLRRSLCRAMSCACSNRFRFPEAVSAAIRWVVDSIQVLFQPLPVPGSGISRMANVTDMQIQAVPTASGSRKRYQRGGTLPTAVMPMFQPLPVRGSGISLDKAVERHARLVPTASANRKRYQPRSQPPPIQTPRSNRSRFAEAASAWRQMWPRGKDRVPTAPASRKRHQRKTTADDAARYPFQPLPLRGSGISDHIADIEADLARFQPLPLRGGGISVAVIRTSLRRSVFQPLPLRGGGISAVAPNPNRKTPCSNRFRFAEAVSATLRGRLSHPPTFQPLPVRGSGISRSQL